MHRDKRSIARFCLGGVFWVLWGCSKQAPESVPDEVGSTNVRDDEMEVLRDVEPDPLVQRMEAGDWRSLDQEYWRISKEMKGETRRLELLRLHKRAMAVDFKKIEDRVRREWVEEDGADQDAWFDAPRRRTVQMECDRLLAQAYGCLYGLTVDMGSTSWACGDYSQEMWDVWFDYIEKMIAENHRLNRDRLFGCEDAIRQIEEYRTVQFGGGTPQLDKDVDEWLHEKFLRIVGRPMANGK